uniref:SRCR domain-containing protein n=1 Tax=Scleropages formosus TaxID=113540 RepID=A0A8C9V5A6_SCLFO
MFFSVSVSLLPDSDVRLVNGNSPCEGRVEVRHQGQWGTVCSWGWDITDASVVCRQMFCGDAVAAPPLGHFGAGKGKIWLAAVRCRGSESTLKDCGRGGSGTDYDCGHSEDAGVICSDLLFFFSGLAVRLAGGPHPCSGRLEFHHKGSLYTVCDPDFDLQDAKVVCRQLGCGTPVQVQGAAVFGKGDDLVWKNKVECGGDEQNFGQCVRSSTKETKCTHDTDVGLECFCKLVGDEGGCAGRLEVFHQGSWGTVCGDSWDPNDAQVVCRQLQCGMALRSTSFGPGNGSIWLDEVGCVGNESSLWDCPSAQWGNHDCIHKEDVGVDFSVSLT